MILGKPICRLLASLYREASTCPAYSDPTITGNGHTTSLYLGPPWARLCYQAPSSYQGSATLDYRSADWRPVAPVVLGDHGGQVGARTPGGTVLRPRFAGHDTPPPPAWPCADLMPLPPGFGPDLATLLPLAAGGNERMPLWAEGGELLATDGHRAASRPCDLGGLLFALDHAFCKLVMAALAVLPLTAKVKDAENPKKSKVVAASAWSVWVSPDRVAFVGWSLDGTAQSLLIEGKNQANSGNVVKPGSLRKVITSSVGEPLYVERDAILDLCRLYDRVSLYRGSAESPSATAESVEGGWALYGPKPDPATLAGTYNATYLRQTLPAASAHKLPAILEYQCDSEGKLSYQGGCVVMPAKAINPAKPARKEEDCKPTPPAVAVKAA